MLQTVLALSHRVQTLGHPKPQILGKPSPQGQQASRTVLRVQSSALYEDYETRHTLGSLYLPKSKQHKVATIDHHAKRVEKDIKEVAQAGIRLGLSESQVRENMEHLQSLLPGFRLNLFKMKASDWAKVLSNVTSVADVIITFKTLYPGVNANEVVRTSPKMLLQDSRKMEDDAKKVRAILHAIPDQEFSAIIEAVPSLMDPRQLQSSLADLKRWFPKHDPVEMLLQDPKKLQNVDEADLEADPLYGEITSAG